METLRQLADRCNVLIGAAVSPDTIEAEADYRAALAREFNCVTAENCMKPMYLQRRRGEFDFAEADKLVAFARASGMKLRGHTLVWHNQMCPWVREGKLAKDEALDEMCRHIQAVASHFRGAAFCWDVVNEALGDEGGWREKSPWFQMIGPEYLDWAFRWAHQADPDAQLFYNDYGMDQGGPKADACYEMLRSMRDRGVPVHGVGFQYHLGVENKLDHDQCVANFRRFADLGLIVHFTEMDMGIPKPITTELRYVQAAEYANRIRIGLDAKVAAMVFWGLTDRHTWVPSFTKGQYDEPLLLDAACRPKPAYFAVCDVLREHASRA